MAIALFIFVLFVIFRIFSKLGDLENAQKETREEIDVMNRDLTELGKYIEREINKMSDEINLIRKGLSIKTEDEIEDELKEL